MNPYTRRQIIKTLKDAIIAAELLPEDHECATCVFFSQGYCSYWKDRIPDEFIPVGCTAWVFDENAPPF